MQKIKAGLRYLLTVFFVLAGVNHFVSVAPYLRIIPPYLPWPLALVYVSGFFEIAGGIALLVPKVARFGAWGLIALLIAVFPANIHMALNHQLFPEFPQLVLWLRLPLQFVFIIWCYFYTRPETVGVEPSH